MRPPCPDRPWQPPEETSRSRTAKKKRGLGLRVLKLRNSFGCVRGGSWGARLSGLSVWLLIVCELLV